MSSEHISLVGEQMSSGSLTGEQVSDEHLSVGEHLSSEQMSYLIFRVNKCRLSKCHGLVTLRMRTCHLLTRQMLTRN